MTSALTTIRNATPFPLMRFALFADFRLCDFDCSGGGAATPRGFPHFGHARALSLISFPHSLQLISAMVSSVPVDCRFGLGAFSRAHVNHQLNLPIEMRQ